MLSDEIKRKLLRDMIRIRSLEEGIVARYGEQEMRCPVHLSIGQEASAVGVCSALKASDWAFSGHRNHAHYIAKGGSLQKMLAEIYGKATGCCGGKGGSMHLTDLDAGFIGATPIVGSTVPIAVGAALTAKYKHPGKVVVIFLGDGAMEAGVVSESINLAVLKNLPIIFICENNLYSVYSPMSVRQPPQRSISQFAEGHGIKTESVDGNDVEVVFKTVTQVVENVRAGHGPCFIELKTYRWREHCGPNFDNDIGYRSEEEFIAWKKKDPIALYSPQFSNTEEEFQKAEIEVNQAFDFARSSPFPDLNTASQNVCALSDEIEENDAQTSRMLSYAGALREAQDICLEQNQDAYLMGLGVPDPKGVFGTTLALQDKYGEDRVFDIPLSENALTGVALGSAITGLRPILTHQRVDFALVSIEQIVNQAAKWHYMFNGQMNASLVIRMIIGRGWGQGPQHSQSLHAWFAHIPGLKVIMPTTAYDAKGMLIAAIEDNNPVICLEHRWLYGIQDKVPQGVYRVPLDKARVVQEGADITLIGVSYMTLECLSAAEMLAEHGVKVEVIDLRSIRPLDSDTILASVLKTGRVLIVDHAELACGVASEIAAMVSENLFDQLKSTPARMGLPDYPVPTSTVLADHYYPLASDIAQRVCEILKLDVTLNTLPSMNKRLDQPDPSFKGPF